MRHSFRVHRPLQRRFAKTKRMVVSESMKGMVVGMMRTLYNARKVGRELGICTPQNSFAMEDRWRDGEQMREQRRSDRPRRTDRAVDRRLVCRTKEADLTQFQNLVCHGSFQQEPSAASELLIVV